jgi:hypothetical protein
VSGSALAVDAAMATAVTIATPDHWHAPASVTRQPTAAQVDQLFANLAGLADNPVHRAASSTVDRVFSELGSMPRRNTENSPTPEAADNGLVLDLVELDFLFQVRV